jgi:hypothetical protein
MRIEFVANLGFWKKVAFSSLALLLLISVAGFAGWRLRAHILGHSPAQQEMISRKINSPVPDTLRYVESEEGLRSLFMDEKASLAGLFESFGHQDASNASLSLVSLKVGSKYCGMFQKPFRLRLSESSPSTDPYFLLIREITEEGAVALDTEGRERPVTRNFVLNHWGSEISWVYAHKDKARSLTNGRDDSNILEIQRTLIDMGYRVALTGVYDDATQQGLKAFQKDFGLYADGVADFMTRAVLYQMTEAY